MPQTLSRFKKKFPAIWKAYEHLRGACDNAGPLDRKTVELIKVGISAALEREGGLVAHISKAQKAGATSPEIYQAILQGLGLTGFPASLAGFRVAQRKLKH